MTLSLCVVGHAVPGRHVPGCLLEGCDGCMPALAEADLWVCAWHERRARGGLRTLPELWADLADPRRGIRQGGARGSDDGSPMLISDAARETRTAIRSLLVWWCEQIADEYGTPPPDEANIAATSRALAAAPRRALLAAQDLDELAASLDAQDHFGLADLVRTRAELRRGDAARDEPAAAAAREDRESGLDVVRALAEHIDRHARRLLASGHAVQLCADILGHTAEDGSAYEGALTRARRLAMPARGGVQVTCLCGQRLILDVDPSDRADTVTCPGCGEWGTAAWWRHRLAPPIEGPLPAAEIVSWLILEHQILLTEAQIRQWASRGLAETKLTRMGRDARNRVLYDRDQVLAFALASPASTASTSAHTA